MWEATAVLLAMTSNTFDLDSNIRWQDKSENSGSIEMPQNICFVTEDTEDNA